MDFNEIYAWFKRNLNGNTKNDEATQLLYLLMREDVLSISKLVSLKEEAMRDKYNELKEDASNICAFALMYKNKTYEMGCKNGNEVKKNKEQLDTRTIEAVNKLGFFKIKVE